jgi:hypothetical protein
MGDCVNAGASEYCKTTSHLVYLAAFTDKFVKVGTTAEKRGRTRLLEQGANYAMIIARTPSQGLAKQIERYVGTSFSIPDKRNNRIKEDSLKPSFQISDFASLLDGKIEEIKSEKSDFSKFFLKKAQKFDFYSRYATLLRGDGITRVHVMKDKKGEESHIEGRIVCPKGDFLVLDNNGLVSAVELSSKRGNLLANGAPNGKRQLDLL